MSMDIGFGFNSVAKINFVMLFISIFNRKKKIIPGIKYPLTPLKVSIKVFYSHGINVF